MMKLIYGWMVLGALYHQGALGVPRPDFGIDGSVAGSATVETVAGNAGAEFDLIDLKTITLESHYTRLHNLEQDLTAIGTKIATDGKDLAGKIETLATSTQGLTDLFTDADSAIDTLRTLLVTGLTGHKGAIDEMVGTYISTMLNDASDQLVGTLGRLQTQLGLLKTAIDAAVAAYDATPIPAIFLRRYVSPKVIYELLRGLHDLRSELPLVTYIIELTLGHLQNADIYLTDVMVRVNGAVFEVIMHYDGFRQEIWDSALSVPEAFATPLRLSYTAQTEELDYIMADLALLDSYSTDLAPVFTAYEEALKSSNRDALAGQIETMFYDYLKLVVKLDDHIDRFYDEKLCWPVQSVLQVLIASGPWADYCFSKYSPRVAALASINANRFQMCYEIEADRLQRLNELADRMTAQIIFDVEDLATHVSECFFRLERASDCVALIGPYYIALGGLLAEKQTDLVNLIDYETTASVNRMAACVNSGKCGMLATAEKIVAGVLACGFDGPNASID